MKGFFVVVHDISEQRKSSEMLKESETKFRSLVNRIPDAVWTANARGDFQYFSSNVEDLTGFTADEIVAKDYRFWRERIHPEDQEEYQMAWVRFFRDRKPFAMEFRFQKRSGEWTWMLARAEALYERGEQTLTDGLLDDISDRKITEQRIREQARLLDLAQDAIVVRDLNRRILYWNHGAEVMFGWPASDVLEKDMTEQIFRNMDALVAAEKILLEKDEWNGELHCFAKSGKEVIVSSRWTLVKNEEGKPASILSINTNITEKRRLESQFLRAQRMESIGTMAGGVAHDLNNILAPIMMSAPLLRQDSLPASEREALLNTIESNSERGGDLIRQLLMFGRGIEGEKSVVQVKFLIREMVKIARETFPRNMSVSEEVDNDLWPVLGDATHIHQILLNLCVNARDAMPDGGKLKVAAGNQLLDEHYSALDSELKSGPYITIKVSDSGHGISPADLEKIFDPFFTTKDVGKGTGLGLSTVMGIVKGMGGIIHVYSERGKGTSFNVFLPAEPTAKEDAGTERKALAMGHGETILVVDDEDGILQATCKLLTKHGYQSLPASDGAEALSVFSRNRESINAVLTDVMMPVMDGLDLVRVIRKMDPVMKVVASSGLEDDSKFEALKNLGVSTFLAKPYTAEKLLTTLRNILDE